MRCCEDISVIDPVRSRVKSVVFTDCANAYRSIGSITVGSVDKATRLHLDYIRGDDSTNILSFCDAIFNSADLGDKLGASAINWRKFSHPVVFVVSCVGRISSIALLRCDAEK